MQAQPTVFDAFRYADIQAPRTGSRRYIIRRSSYDFPQTALEGSLVGLKRDSGYLQALRDAVTDLAAKLQDPSFLPADGYLDSIAALDELLLDRRLPEEVLCERFASVFKSRLGGSDIDVFLRVPASRVWDLYLSYVIEQARGKQLPPNVHDYLICALRVGAACFLILRAKPGDDIGLARVGSASLAVDPALVDPAALRSARPKPEAPVPDGRARELQDRLVSQLLLLQLLSDQLRQALHDPFIATVPPPAPTSLGGQVSKGGARLSLAIPEKRLTPTTIALLTAQYGGQHANGVVTVEPLPALVALDSEIRRSGEVLYRTADATSIVRMREKLELLSVELRAAGPAGIAQQIAALPLIVTPTPSRAPRLPTETVNPNVRPLGVAQLKVLKQTLLRYEPGEVAHIENVLQGESRERTHTVKQTTEETITFETERSTSSERDLQTTDRFELAEETSSTISSQRQNEAGVTVTASYGPVSISANTKYTDSSSRQQGEKLSRNFAREVVDRSVERVQQRVREERVRKTTLQIEEINRHALTSLNKSVVGIYRWVDKIYWAQVHVYGARMMLEFMIPEPASTFLYGTTKRPADPVAVEPPKPMTFTARDIERDNYTSLARDYGAAVEDPPPLAQSSIHGSRTDNDTQERKIEIPDGWIGVRANIMATWIEQGQGVLNTLFGNCYWQTQDSGYQYLTASSTGNIPILVETLRITSYSVTIQLVTTPSSATFEKWQLKTYKAIADAYALRRSEYEAYLASRSRTQSDGQSIPDRQARSVERQELQRACIEMLTRDHYSGNGGLNFTKGWPEIDFTQAEKLGPSILFLQQSFEWEQMTYIFYPYYWADQDRWGLKLASSGGDEVFTRFLSAGYARVVVPVRSAHEADVAYYLETGGIWGGGQPPILGGGTYLDIIDEIKETLDAPDGGVPQGDPWQVKIPTSLVMIDDSGKLPAWPEPTPQIPFLPSDETCNGVPYNAAQWKDAKAVADGIRGLGYLIPTEGDQAVALRKSRGAIRAMQLRFNSLGASSVLGRALTVDGIVGPCTLRALSYFDSLKSEGKWPGAA